MTHTHLFVKSVALGVAGCNMHFLQGLKEIAAVNHGLASDHGLRLRHKVVHA